MKREMNAVFEVCFIISRTSLCRMILGILYVYFKMPGAQR